MQREEEHHRGLATEFLGLELKADFDKAVKYKAIKFHMNMQKNGEILKSWRTEEYFRDR